MNKTVLLSLLSLLFISQITAQKQDTIIQKKKYFTRHLQAAVTLDGIPNEAAWNDVDWGGDFIQSQPYEERLPSHPTQFKILYDDRYLYIAYNCLDASPDSISRRMGRRDEFPGDWIEVNIDSYHDLRTAFSFTLSVSGVRGDEFVSNNGNNWDDNWNPIWFAKTHINKTGWTAEVKIPLSQLRYNNDPEKIWGIQFTRRIFRKEERSIWQFIPQGSGVWVSSFGELHGLKNIPLHRQIEIAPYLTTQVDAYRKEPGNPFAKGTDAKVSAGLDGKVAITNDLIMDFTINPDFGQVEADPSQVRIDGFQTYLDEKRPFFIESNNIFEYQLTGSEAGGDYDADLLFYSRRIGSSPHGYPHTNSGEYVKYPQNTSILGAAKFSGKTRKGWSIGILESLTGRENATIDNNGKRRKELVEPLTNYAIARIQKDINGGNTIIGGIFTAVNRDKGLDDILHKSAYSGGLDFIHFWKNRSWFIKANAVFSNVNGTKAAILNTQTSFEHLFQRIGAKEVSVDTNRTSLSGTGGTFKFGKIGGKTGKYGQIFKFETGITFRSPELEMNDIGFMLTANEINHFTWAAIQWQKAFSIFRNARINYNHWFRWDFSGQLLYQQFNVNAHTTFKNNWQTGSGVTWNPYDVSNTSLRGDGSVRRPAGIGWNWYVNTDSRKKVSASFNIFKFWGEDHTLNFFSPAIGIYYVPVNTFNINLSFSYDKYWRKQDQFVESVMYNNTVRTIVARVNQNTLRFTGRLTYNITPDLTIQYYGQPFITRPVYSNFGYVVNGLAKNFADRFTAFKPNQVEYNNLNGTYSIDENNDGITDYSFSSPDFNFVQFRSNLIVRWEYKPGSELYFVWSDGNTPDVASDLQSNIFNSLLNNAFSGGKARNIFLVKWTYRFVR
ncbi:MAG: carbohydrate binding family 9 domain-containing protein [Bacteroidetes bacterium]|nr:carbohydrate binding family 9 domain-containing protein [Bacteroidota bacterium]